MARHILRCVECGSYTMEDTCRCGGAANTVRPPKFSPDDRFAGYTRQAKRDQLVEKGLL